MKCDDNDTDVFDFAAKFLGPSIYWIQLCFIARNFHSDYLSSHN